MATQRHRERYIEKNYPTSIIRHASSSSYNTPIREVQETDDSLTPNFHHLRKRGVPLPVNEFSTDKRFCTCFPGHATLTNLVTSQVNQYTGPIFSPSTPIIANLDSTFIQNPSSSWTSFPDTTSPDFDSNDILQQALARARTLPWDISTFLAELRKTLRMIRRTGTRTARRAERILQKPGIKTLEEFSSAWLEYRYGWRPLLFDIRDMNEAIENLFSTTAAFRRATSFNEVVNRGGNTYSHTDLTLFAPGTGFGSDVFEGVTMETSYSDTVRHSIRAGVALEGTISDLIHFDPLVTAWELVPYSFIVDWFINIDEAIKAFSPFGQGTVRWAFVTIANESERKVVTRPTGHINPDISVVGSASVWTVSHVKVHRIPASPSLNLSLRFDLDELQVADLLALILRPLIKMRTITQAFL